MFCPKCRNSLPDDSKFCQYCGVSVNGIQNQNNAAKSTVCITDNPPSAYASESSLSNKKVHCKHCGGVVDINTNICTFCGKPYQNKRKYGRSILITILILLAGLNTFQYYSYNTKLTEKDDHILGLERQVEDLEEANANYKRMNTVYNSIELFISSGKATYYNKYKNYFASTNIVVVEEGKTATFSVTSKTAGMISMSGDTILYMNSEWGKDWNGDTCNVTVTGKSAGATVLTFTKENTSDMFYVLVIVV